MMLALSISSPYLATYKCFLAIDNLEPNYFDGNLIFLEEVALL